MPLTFFAGGCRQRLSPIMKHHNRLVHPCKYQLGSAWFALSRADLLKFWPKKAQKREKGKISDLSYSTGITYWPSPTSLPSFMMIGNSRKSHQIVPSYAAFLCRKAAILWMRRKVDNNISINTNN